MKIGTTKQIISEYLTEKFKGKRIRIWFAEYGTSGSNCKYVNSTVNIAKHPSMKKGREDWLYKNITEFQPEVSSISLTSIKNWYLIKFVEPIFFAECEVKDMIVSNQFINVIK